MVPASPLSVEYQPAHSPWVTILVVLLIAAMLAFSVGAAQKIRLASDCCPDSAKPSCTFLASAAA
jgi:hypothetical protein